MDAERYEKSCTKFCLIVENWRVVCYVLVVGENRPCGLFMERGVIRIRLFFFVRVFKISSQVEIPIFNNSL